MNNFEIARKYGPSVFVIHKLLEKFPNIRVEEISKKINLHETTIRECLKLLIEIKLVNKNSSKRHQRYSTVVQ